MEEVLQAIALKQQLDSMRPLDKEQEAKIMQKFRLDWNYHSNNLEGNSLTYGETKALIMYGVTALGKPLKDHFEVTGHNEAINWVIDVVKGDYPLTQSFIRELHTLLLKEPYQVDAQTPDGSPTKKWVQVGTYKSSPNHVQTKTGEIFYFATPEETPAEMAGLMEWYIKKTEDESFNRILLAAEFHYKFIRIHPFDDGNGRTARILMNFILMKFDYPPVIIKTEDKENYYAALRLADVGELEPFVNYIATNLIRSLEIMITGANGENIEEPDDIDKEIALLEKRLSGLGEEIEERSEEIVEGVFRDIRDIASEIKNKLSDVERFYHNKSIVIYIDNNEYTKELEFDLKRVSDIRLYVNYYGLKKPGLDNFRFYDEFKIEFKQLKYFVYNNENRDIPILIKYYHPLSKGEKDKLLTDIIKRHNKELDEALNKKEREGQEPSQYTLD
ncbi:MAG: Fic family protein [Bacteroidota bacterium]